MRLKDRTDHNYSHDIDNDSDDDSSTDTNSNTVSFLRATQSMFLKGLIGFFIAGLVLLWLDGFANSSILMNNSLNHNHISLTGSLRTHGNKQHVIVSHLVNEGASESEVTAMANFFNKMYTGSMSIGTPSQTFKNMVFDTGSADLWVMSYDDKGDDIPDESYLNYFKSSLSSSYVGPIDSWSIAYGTGKAKGKSAEETVTIASMTVTSQIFAIATSISDMSVSEYEPQDGICGFARKQASNLQSGTPLMETLYDQGINTNGLFAFLLSKHSDSGSKLIIGDDTISNTYYKGNTINWIPLTNQSGYDVPGLWTIKINNVKIGNNNLYSEQYAIVDTGTTYIGVPNSIYDNFMKTIISNRDDCNKESSSSSAIYLCTDTINPSKNLPKLKFSITDSNNNEIELNLNGEDYVDDDGQLGFMSISLSKDNIWILGDTFLKNYYSVYDDINEKVGFAESSYNDNGLSDLMKSVLIIAIIVVSILLILSCLRWYITRKQSRYFSGQALLMNNNVAIQSES